MPGQEMQVEGLRARGAIGRVEWGAILLVLAVGVLLRCLTTSGMWLDEALSVNIARLGLSDQIEALRHDGHPPLYYALLHLWMRLFGESDLAVRTLSGLFSVATLPLIWALARRRGGEVAALAAVTVAAVLPFATRYATEARMYALMVLLVAAGWLLLDRLLAGRGGRGSVAGLGLVAALLLYTQYWALFVLGVTGLALLICWGRSGDPTRRRGARQGVIALLAGAAAFLPWLPVLLDQLAHTGTPWGGPQRPTASAIFVVLDFAGTPVVVEGIFSAFYLSLLVLVGLAGTPRPPASVLLDLRTVPGVRTEFGIAVAILVVGLGVSLATGSTFQTRYATYSIPVVAVAAGMGVAAMPSRASRNAAAGLAILLLGVPAGLGATEHRTQGPEAAAAVAGGAEPGDVVLICPDQLGPAFARGLEPALGLRVLTYPALSGPERVDWRDYEERNTAAEPEVILQGLLEEVGDGALWLVWMGGYETYDTQCEELWHILARSRPRTEVVEAGLGEVFEPMWVDRFGPPGS